MSHPPSATGPGLNAWLRGSIAMARDAYTGTVDLVAEAHDTISETGARFNPIIGCERSVRRVVYTSVRGIGALSFTSARTLAAWVPDRPVEAGFGPGASYTKTVRAALNGAIGDYLETSGNGLAQSMQLIDGQGQVVDWESAEPIGNETTGRWVVLIHGLGMHDGHWRHEGAPDFGDRLAADYGYTARRLRYNSGRSIDSNAQEFAECLEMLLERRPSQIQYLTLIGHSMGGLIARRAIAWAHQAGYRWPSRLSAVVCLGSPHDGAPLERLGQHFNQALTYWPYSRAFAAIGEQRSAGIKDLRSPRSSYSRVPAHAYLLVAASLGHESERWGHRFGDLLVPIDSAVSRATSFSSTITRRIIYGIDHFGLLYREQVYAVIAAWLSRRHAEPRSSESSVYSFRDGRQSRDSVYAPTRQDRNQ